MIGLEYLIAFSMSITNLFKNKLPVAAVPFASLGLAVMFNILNALIFNGDPLVAAKEAFCNGGIVVGLFNVGTVTRKLVQGENPLSREEIDDTDSNKT